MMWLLELVQILPSTADLPLDEVLGFEGYQDPPPHHHLVKITVVGIRKENVFSVDNYSQTFELGIR